MLSQTSTLRLYKQAKALLSRAKKKSRHLRCGETEMQIYSSLPFRSTCSEIQFPFVSIKISAIRLEEYMSTDAVYERRGKPRINKPFHAQVYGVGSDGNAFDTTTVLKNISSTGFYLLLDREQEVGAELSVNVRLSTSATDDVPTASVALKGIVVRVEPQQDGAWGLAVSIKKHWFAR